MSAARTLLASAAATALAAAGLFAHTATADAAPTPVRPPAAKNAFAAGLIDGDINPKSFPLTKGTRITISGTVGWAGDTPANITLKFNPAPASWVSCKAASAERYGALSNGMIAWANLPASTQLSTAKWSIVCTLQRDIATTDVARDTITVSSKGAVQVGGSYEYAINGQVGTQAPTKAPSKAPTKDKDSTGGLSKTGV